MTETLYGHSFSASSISAINKPLDAGLQAFCRATAQWELPLQVRYEKARGPAGVEFVVSDNREGLKAAIHEPLPEAAW